MRENFEVFIKGHLIEVQKEIDINCRINIRDQEDYASYCRSIRAENSGPGYSNNKAIRHSYDYMDDGITYPNCNCDFCRGRKNEKL